MFARVTNKKETRMKKIFGILIAAFGLWMAMPSQAQVKFGVKGGLNITKLKFKESAFSSENKTGWFIGPMVEFKVPIVGLAMDAAALYTQNDLNAGKATVTQKTLECPINVKYEFGLGDNAGFYLAAGPQFGFNIGAKNIKEFKDDFRLKDHELSFNLGGGVRLLRHIQAGVTYNFSIDEITKGSTYETKKNTWQVSVAYLF